MTKPYAHIVGQLRGEDLHAFELGIDFTAVAMQRLGRAIVLHDLRVINTFYVRPPPGPHHTIWMEVTIPASKVEAAKAELGRSVSSCGPPARPSAGLYPPTPTWGDLRDQVDALRDQVDALLREHRGPMLPCGHPVALLVFDGADGAIYRCPGCERDKAEIQAQAGRQP